MRLRARLSHPCFYLPGQHMRPLILSTILCVGAVMILWGCSSQDRLNLPIRTEMQMGDRERDWAMVFFQSWRQHRQSTYLNLSRRHMAGAVKTYFDLQVKIGHSFPDFYTLDRRRRSGCSEPEGICSYMI